MGTVPTHTQWMGGSKTQKKQATQNHEEAFRGLMFLLHKWENDKSELLWSCDSQKAYRGAGEIE